MSSALANRDVVPPMARYARHPNHGCTYARDETLGDFGEHYNLDSRGTNALTME